MKASRFASFGLAALALVPVALPASGQPEQAPVNHHLAAEIDRLFDADIKDEMPGRALHARIRLIFANYGVPSDKLVGKQAAGEYVALVSGEPLTFVGTFLPQLQRAADTGE